jgi:hypothetical protein
MAIPPAWMCHCPKLGACGFRKIYCSRFYEWPASRNNKLICAILSTSASLISPLPAWTAMARRAIVARGQSAGGAVEITQNGSRWLRG